MFLDVTGEVMDDMPASKLNESPGKWFKLIQALEKQG